METVEKQNLKTIKKTHETHNSSHISNQRLFSNAFSHQFSCLEMLSPQIVKQAKTAKSSGDAPKTKTGITTDLHHLSEKIQIAKKLNEEVAQETISDGLKQTMAELSYEGNKLAEQLRNIQTGENRRVDNLENTISDLKLELDAAKSASFIQGGFIKMSYFGVKHGHLRSFLGKTGDFRTFLGLKVQF